MDDLSDSFFTMGKDHTVCQDFALACQEGDPIPFAIVSDGCSKSAHSDVGSRLICFSGRVLVQESPEAILPLAETSAALLSIPKSALFATLMLLRASPEGSWSSHIFGDGIRVRARIVGETIEELELNQYTCLQCPPYPYYKRDPIQWESYLKQESVMLSSGGIQSPLIPPHEETWDPSDHFNFAMVGSDGFMSFKDLLCEEVVKTLVTRIARTPKTRGFLERCMIATFRRSPPHGDDVSAAALWRPL